MMYMYTRLKFNWNEMDYSWFASYYMFVGFLGNFTVFTQTSLNIDLTSPINGYNIFLQEPCLPSLCSVKSWKLTMHSSDSFQV